ncbi:MAG: DUF2290 domain-containing protein [Desulfitobacterium hafniense]|nr:DUF2290 domain-containing protein [Desulfitobacterium hafniense]
MAKKLKANPKSVLSDIKRSVGLIRKNDYLPLSDKTFLNNETISWGGFEGGIYKGSYKEIYEQITMSEDFSFGIGRIYFDESDDPISDFENVGPAESSMTGFFQFYYQFEKGSLLKARLAFYPDSKKWDNFLRIDLDLASQKEESHSECHLQIYPLEDMRVPLSTLPPPSAFIEFCIRHFFPELHKAIFKDLCCHEPSLEDLFKDKKSLRGVVVGFHRY